MYMARTGQVKMTGNKYFIHLMQRCYFVISTFIYHLFQFSFDIQTKLIAYKNFSKIHNTEENCAVL